MLPNYHSFLDKIVAYKPGQSRASVDCVDAGAIIRLCSNENVFGSPLSTDQVSSFFSFVHEYPDLPSSSLFPLLSNMLSVQADQLIFVNGSDELLQLISLAYLDRNSCIVSSQHTFSQYRFIADIKGARYIEVPLSPDFNHDLNALSDTVIREGASCVCLALPNNPTGLTVSIEDVDKFIQSIPSTVLIVLDQAYVEFDSLDVVKQSPLLVKKYPNVCMMRTFSKAYGLAGMRIGYGIGSSAVISVLNKVKQPFNVNVMAIKSAEYALGCTDFLNQTLTNNQEQKQYLYQAFKELSLPFYPSAANFICVDLNQPANRVVKSLESMGILIRDLTSFGLDTCVRVTIGLPEQNAVFIRALKEVLNDGS